MRDPFGEKPLYYGRIGRCFAFASDLAAFRAHPAWDPRIDRNAVALMMRHSCVPAPYSIYQGIYKLRPGTILTLDPDGSEPRLEAYWSAREAAERGRAQPFAGTPTLEESILSDVLSVFVISQVEEERANQLGSQIVEGANQAITVGPGDDRSWVSSRGTLRRFIHAASQIDE